MLKKLRSMSDSSFDTSDCETKIMIMALLIYFFSFIITFSNGVLRSYICILRILCNTSMKTIKIKRGNSKIELAIIHLCFKSFH